MKNRTWFIVFSALAGGLVYACFFFLGGAVFSEQDHHAEFIIILAGFIFTSVSFLTFHSLIGVWENTLLVILAFFVIKIFLYLILAIAMLYIWPETRKSNISILLISYFMYTIIETLMKWKLVDVEN